MRKYTRYGHSRRTSIGYWLGYGITPTPVHPIPQRSNRRVYRDADGTWRCKRFSTPIAALQFESQCELLGRPCYDPVFREWERKQRERKEEARGATTNGCTSPP